MKEPVKSGFEQDAIYARRYYKFTNRAGVCKKAKKQINKRTRRNSKLDLKEAKQ
jgi:hypothetical protein